MPVLGALSSSFTNTASFVTPTGIHWTLQSYKDVFSSLPSYTSLGAPLVTSNRLGFWVATLTVVVGLILARRIAKSSGSWSQRITDVFLMGSVAIPGIVLGIGYIFFYDQRFITHHIVDLYETTPLIVLGLSASALPGQSRLLLGPVSQIQSSLNDAARVHGAGKIRAWRTTTMPLLSRAIVWAWVLTFTKTISELAVAQILFVPGQQPASVTIEQYLGTVFASVGSAATVITLAEMLGVIGVVLLVYRLVTPRGWRRIGEAGANS
jgi:iron(III) transport system permease protein